MPVAGGDACLGITMPRNGTLSQAAASEFAPANGDREVLRALSGVGETFAPRTGSIYCARLNRYTAPDSKAELSS